MRGGGLAGRGDLGGGARAGAGADLAGAAGAGGAADPFEQFGAGRAARRLLGQGVVVLGEEVVQDAADREAYRRDRWMGTHVRFPS